MEDVEKIVEFDRYCNHCEHQIEDENNTECPCYICIATPTNTYSHKPIKFKEREKH